MPFQIIRNVRPLLDTVARCTDGFRRSSLLFLVSISAHTHTHTHIQTFSQSVADSVTPVFTEKTSTEPKTATHRTIFPLQYPSTIVSKSHTAGGICGCHTEHPISYYMTTGKKADQYTQHPSEIRNFRGHRGNGAGEINLKYSNTNAF